MGDEFWSRYPQMQPPASAAAAAAAAAAPPGMLKRPRTENEIVASQQQVSAGHEMLNHLPPQDNRGVPPLVVKDNQSLGSAYDNYLQNTQLSLSSGQAISYGGGGGVQVVGGGSLQVVGGGGLQVVGGGFPPIHMRNPVITGPEHLPNGQRMEFIGQFPREGFGRPREPLMLPPDASGTLYVEGLPPDCTKREVVHIFRPFVGYREVRLVTKGSKHRGGEPLVLSFVDFVNPACAATALNALQGYVLDESDSRSTCLRLQFSKNPGPRSGSGPSRRKR